MFEFKVHTDDWLERIQERVVCPFCGHAAEPVNWNTEEQSEHLREVALSHVSQRLNSALRRDAQKWNRSQPRGGFVTMTMKVDGRPKRVPLPPSSAGPMRLRISCSQCGCRYAVVGAAFYCPGCGQNDAEVLFGLAISGIRGSLQAIPQVRAAISDPDTSENIVRSLIENGLQSSVTAFQRYVEALYPQLAPESKPRRNAFQNLSEGSELWHDAAGRHYSDYLSTAEMTGLKRAFQQRHLLAHTQGIVDQDYIANSGDTTHQVGQRVVIRDTTVQTYLDAIQKLAIGLLETRNNYIAGSSGETAEVSRES